MSTEIVAKNMKLLFVTNVDWFFISHRLPVALAALKAGHEVHIATFLTRPVEELESYGLNVHPLASRRNNFGLFSLAENFIEIFRLFRNVKPDVVHLVTIKPLLLGGIAANLVRVPGLVVAISGLGSMFISERPFVRLLKLCLLPLYRIALRHRNLKIITQNEDDRKIIQRLSGQTPERFQILPGSGVDLQKYKYVPEPGGDKIVLLAGRLLREKGVGEFVEASKRLRPIYPGVRFVLVGSPDHANPSTYTESQLSAWQKEGAVEWWGHRKDMPEVLSRTHLVVLPSYREGFPKVLIEAASCGRAVITTDVPGCRDAIDPGVTGLLVPVRNVEALAEAMQEMLNDPKYRKAMGYAGRRRAETMFPVEKIVDTHLKIYQDLMASSQSYVPA